MHRMNTVTRETSTVTSGRRTDTKRVDLRERLKPALSQTVAAEPVKELAQDTGISWRTLEDMKAGRRLCDLPNALAIMAARPNSPLSREIAAILSGSAEANSPENIDRMLRFFSRSGGT